MGFNKRTYYFIIILMLACTTGTAQMSFSPIAFSTGSVSATGGTAILSSGKGDCLKVSSGISTLSTIYNNKGEFGKGCKEVPPVADLVNVSVSLKLFPNPTNGPATLKCEGQFDENLSSQIRIIHMSGKVMMSQMVPMKDVKAGFVLNAGSFPAGTYVVTMEFMNQRYSMKLIKL